MIKLLNTLGIVLALSIVTTSCEKAPFLTLTTPKTITFTDQGGSQSITFIANRDWSVSSSETWCKVTPSSGNKADGNITITLNCEPNTTYDSRSATLTVRVEELSEAITVTQDTNLGLLVSPTSYDLTNAAQSIEVAVRANVKYTVEVDAACKDWINQTATKALSSEKITFSIAANESYDNREGKITIKQTDGNISETIVVRQRQTNGLFITTPEYDLSNEEHTLSIEVKANVSFQVSPQVDWIKYVDTKTLTSSTIVLTIEANKIYDNRSGTVLVKQTNGDLSGTIIINQKQTDGLFVTPTDVDVDNAEHTIELEVKNNVAYDVVIPDDAKEWISIKSNTATKALADNKVTLTIAQNTLYDDRETSLTIKQTDGALAETVKIKQAQADGLIIGKKEYEVGPEATSIEIDIMANVEVEVSIPEGVSWLTWQSTPQTKGLVSQNAIIAISSYNGYEPRTAIVTIHQIGDGLSESITITQLAPQWLIANSILAETLGGKYTMSIIHNMPYTIDTSSFPEWIHYDSMKTISVNEDEWVWVIDENTSYISRSFELSVISEDKTVSSETTIAQAQKDYCKFSVEKINTPYTSNDFELFVLSNVEYELATLNSIDWLNISERTTVKEEAGLTTYSYTISIGENPYCHKRGDTLLLRKKGSGYPGFIYDAIGYVQEEQPYIVFEDPNAEKACLANFDTNKDGYLTYKEAAAVTKIGQAFNGYSFSSFDEFQYFTGISSIPDNGIPFGGVEYLTIPSSCEYVGYASFRNSNLKRVILMDGVVEIGCYAFETCTQLESIIIPETVKWIDNKAFYGCTSLTSFSFPKEMDVMGHSVLSHCTSLKTLELPSTYKVGDPIGGLFSCCTSLETVVIPEGWTGICKDCFNYCISLKTVSLPSTLMGIGDYAFRECFSLIDITIPENITFIGTLSFDGCTGLEAIYFKPLIPPSIVKEKSKSSFRGKHAGKYIR